MQENHDQLKQIKSSNEVNRNMMQELAQLRDQLARKDRDAVDLLQRAQALALELGVADAMLSDQMCSA
jgi:uncharacterized protein YigA (DUF484 family)